MQIRIYKNKSEICNEKFHLFSRKIIKGISDIKHSWVISEKSVREIIRSEEAAVKGWGLEVKQDSKLNWKTMARWTTVPIVRDMFDREMGKKETIWNHLIYSSSLDMEFGRPMRVFDQHFGMGLNDEDIIPSSYSPYY